MARRKKSKGSGIPALIFAGLVTWAGWPSDLSKMFAGFLILFALWIVATSLIGYIKYQGASSRIDETLVEITKVNLDALARRRAQLLQNDAYGNPRVDRWTKEIDYFISTNILQILDDNDRDVAIERMSELVDYIEKAVVSKSCQQVPYQAFHDDMTPIEYEHYCADELRSVGWDARVTMASRDQGVDIIAEKLGIRLVVQCKLWRTPIGNKAVQEAAAGRAHESADYAVVVGNNSYTRAAEELAQTNKVVLLHHRDLANIDKILSIPAHSGEVKSAAPFSVPASSSAYHTLEEPSAESVGGARKPNRLYYTILILLFLIAAVGFLARDPQSQIEKSRLQAQMAKEKQATEVAPEVPVANATHTLSPLPALETIPDSTTKAPKSSSRAPASPTSIPESSLGNLSRQTPSEKSANDVATDSMKDPDPASRMGVPALPPDEIAGSTLAFRCRPAISGTISSIEISISIGNWAISHITKKGARIERVAQYNVIDTSDGRDLSWQGVHRRNQELKMVAYLSRPNAQGSRIYKEEIISANTGKVAETTAICEILPKALSAPQSR